MIEIFNVGKLPLDKVFLRYPKASVVDNKDFCLFHFFSIISSPRVLSPGGGLPEGLAGEALTGIFLQVILPMFWKILTISTQLGYQSYGCH